MPCLAPDSVYPRGREGSGAPGRVQAEGPYLPRLPHQASKKPLTFFTWLDVEDTLAHQLSAGKLSNPPSHSHLSLGIRSHPPGPGLLRLSWTLITVSDLQSPILCQPSFLLGAQGQ